MLDSRYEETIAKPTASESGTNRAWAAPCMKNDGMKTARMQSIARSRGTAVSRFPWRTARGTVAVCSILRVDVLDLDGRLVDEDADGQGQPAERHQVDRLAGEPEGDDGPAEGERDVQDDDDDAPPVAEEDEHHEPGQDGPEDALGGEARHRVA